MSTKLIGSLLVAAMLVLAGCTGGMGPADDTTTAAGDGDPSETGTVNFFISDQENAISAFSHLNVTVDAVSFRKAGSDDGGDDEKSTTAETATTTAETTSAEATTQADTTTETETEAETETTETESEDGDDSGWETYEVDSKTFDLTELQGENAQKLAAFDLESGTYTEVRLHISDVDGTLKDGEEVSVKLPSDTLKIKSEFTLDAESEVDFVYDISVRSAGNSGKYVIQPVVKESGVNVPYTDIGSDEGDEETDSADGDLSLELVGDAVAGEEATVKVTQAGEPVANANVTVNGEAAGTTGEDGTVSFTVPVGSEVNVEATSGEAEGELDVSLEGTAGVSSDSLAPLA
ncbi:DUF4382 domain-containing protein [Haladaptatus sp. GCM10025707]|uniref:DUF4382 domain-containing protein n=1 Tax=unclassified Haladaptatus TaxID=2622732 RepID=UPI0023E7AA2D|nr:MULTISPECIES: DUF4382 domain-containing protein [unclassified Haladaptatus]